jgi:hypothetical protein
MHRQVLKITCFAMLLAAISCGGSQTASERMDFSELPAKITQATLVGPLCEMEHCTCRDDDDGPGEPASAAVKRYELKVGPVDNDLWVTVGGSSFYKSRERATDCFYIDLPADTTHKVTVRGHGENGFAARVSLSERGELGWYDSFEFDCGGLCDLDSIKSWKQSLDKYTRGIHDPCGSTKIQEVWWESGVAPDKIHPQDLHVELTVKVYGFAPEFAPGDPECANNY